MGDWCALRGSLASGILSKLELDWRLYKRGCVSLLDNMLDYPLWALYALERESIQNDPNSQYRHDAPRLDHNRLTTLYLSACSLAYSCARNHLRLVRAVDPVEGFD